MDPIEFTLSTDLPLMTVSNSTTICDFAAFLQDGDIDYSADNGSSGSTSAANGLIASSSTPPTAAIAKGRSTQKPRLERRCHTKSRRGCYNCKRRRIKCPETHPACGHCAKSGLRCEYPVTTQITHQPSNQIPLFSLQDMRFFQHFLLTCCPHHPLGNESIWTHEVPCLSQKYEFLMHAILGLAASDLMGQDSSLVTFAMAHRLKAIRAIKKALSDMPKANDTFEEGNALLATCYALTFQSVCLDDGMAEFMTFCRGIVIIAVQMSCKGAKFLFRNMLGGDQLAAMLPLLEAVPPIRRDWTDAAVRGITDLKALCTNEVEEGYYQLLSDVAEALYDSSFRGKKPPAPGPLLRLSRQRALKSASAYEILCSHYGWWMQISHEDFQSLVDPRNQVCLLLAAHWISLKQVMATITEAEHQASSQQARRKEHDLDMGMFRWLKHLNRQIDPEHRRYNQWPLWVEAQLDGDRRFFCKGIH
ncbi:hypothetical protein F5X99DRAFT_7681 [Biscogniauxia marginata]|nr:hypothetical protein F5X99DRAFT_7681 [Biscogniauxia marginata]